MNTRYVLITAARNEAKFIEGTILSVINQTIKPAKWYIVSDNSSDNTEPIVEKYKSKYPFIELIKLRSEENRHFASKVYALNSAIDKLEYSEFDFIGILDADITFNDNYYESILKEFEKNQKLGIAGGEFYDIVKNKKIRVLKSLQSVRGGIQLFRKDCFKQIEKFTPLKNGGEDIITEVTARKNGWIVQSFEHQMLEHHRLTGTGGWNILTAKFKEGNTAYSMGYHPLFQLLKSVYRTKEKPIFFGGLLLILGYAWGWIKQENHPVSNDFINFLRSEQLERIKTRRF